MFLVSQTRYGISAKQLERELGVTYKTAMRMLNKIRNQLVDETTYGDKPRAGEGPSGRQEWSLSRCLFVKALNRYEALWAAASLNRSTWKDGCPIFNREIVPDFAINGPS